MKITLIVLVLLWAAVTVVRCGQMLGLWLQPKD